MDFWSAECSANTQRARIITPVDVGWDETRERVFKLGQLVHRDFATQIKTFDYVRMGAMNIVRREDNLILRYTHADHLGSSVAASNNNGSLMWSEHYTPFGEAQNTPAENDDHSGPTGPSAPSFDPLDQMICMRRPSPKHQPHPRRRDRSHLYAGAIL
ncbi:MAG: hypothetical protein AAF216_02900 [Pseudomonadota bacterium]